MNKLEKNYNYAVIRINEDSCSVTLFNKSEVTGGRLTSDVIEDVTVEVDSFGRLHLSGKQREYHFSTERIRVEDLECPVDSDSISHCKGLKLLGWQIIKPYDYVQYWYLLRDRYPVSYVFTNYRIRLLE